MPTGTVQQFHDAHVPCPEQTWFRKIKLTKQIVDEELCIEHCYFIMYELLLWQKWQTIYITHFKEDMSKFRYI